MQIITGTCTPVCFLRSLQTGARPSIMAPRVRQNVSFPLGLSRYVFRGRELMGTCGWCGLCSCLYKDL